LIVHADEDDLGKGDFPDSKTTGHSGKRIGCAIFGRAMCPTKSKSNTRKLRR
jgi:Cu-Zn family superoxide dismutase